MSLKIAMLGYGKMGKSIEQEALARNHSLSYCINSENLSDIELIDRDNTDVVIEFSKPKAAVSNFKKIIPKGIPLVTGTTGWDEHLEEVKALVLAQQGGFLHGSNFSIGVNILFKINQSLAKIMNAYPAYDPFIEERHHRYKKDAPSGTALSLANDLISQLDRKSSLAHTALEHRPPTEDELSVSWIRSGEIFGQHTVGYGSEVDEITLSHRALNRRGIRTWSSNCSGVAF